MTETTIPTPREPDGAPRIGSLDILRGIAILGILFMNINDMGGSLWASFGDVRQIGWSVVDQIAWWSREIFANGTARCLLEMLFGVGMVILTDRAASGIAAAVETPGGRARRVLRWLFGPWAVMRAYYWRNFVLFLFGLVHIFVLMWFGDILHTYGIAAMIAFLFRRCGPKTLLGLGLIMAVMQLFGAGISLYMAQRGPVEVTALVAKRDTGKALTAAEKKKVDAFAKRQAERATEKAQMATRTAMDNKARGPDGNFANWAAACWSVALFIWGVADAAGPGSFLEWMFVWEAASTMLIGAALYRWGVIQGLRSPGFYGRAIVIGYALGLTLRAGEAYAVTRFTNAPAMIYATSEIARLATTLGHIALVHLLLGSAFGVRLLRPFEAAGRTALTIYVAQTLICMWLLYPPFALALYGQQGWMALMLTALAVNMLLLWAANVYVRHYDIAPVEWAWRSIVARRALPWRKAAKGGDFPLTGAIPAA